MGVVGHDPLKYVGGVTLCFDPLKVLYSVYTNLRTRA